MPEPGMKDRHGLRATLCPATPPIFAFLFWRQHFIDTTLAASGACQCGTLIGTEIRHPRTPALWAVSLAPVTGVLWVQLVDTVTTDVRPTYYRWVCWLLRVAIWASWYDIAVHVPEHGHGPVRVATGAIVKWRDRTAHPARAVADRLFFCWCELQAALVV